MAWIKVMRMRQNLRHRSSEGKRVAGGCTFGRGIVNYRHEPAKHLR
jgi:hypothetical protein